MSVPPHRHGLVLTLSLLLLAGCGRSTTAIKPSVNDDRYARLAHEVFSETNRLRAGPGAYVATLQDIIRRMTGNIYQPLDSDVGIVTNEGKSAVTEAVAALGRQKPLRELTWSDELAALARAHVLDTGAKGLVSHNSSTGRGFSERVAGVVVQGKFSAAAENISYGYGNGRDVVAQLLVDDGVPGRGHRTNLLKPQLSHSGVACGHHRQYGHMCVAIYGVDDRE